MTVKPSLHHLWLLVGLIAVAVIATRPVHRVHARLADMIALHGAELVDQPAPDFALVDMTGEPVRLADLRGQVVFLNVWASWCAPCREEMPSMQELSRRLAGRDFTMVAVSIDEREDEMVAFLREHAVNPALMRIVRDPDGRLAARYGTERLPESWIIDRDGHLVARFQGAYDWTQPDMIGFFELLLRDGWRAR